MALQPASHNAETINCFARNAMNAHSQHGQRKHDEQDDACAASEKCNINQYQAYTCASKFTAGKCHDLITQFSTLLRNAAQCGRFDKIRQVICAYSHKRMYLKKESDADN